MCQISNQPNPPNRLPKNVPVPNSKIQNIIIVKLSNLFNNSIYARNTHCEYLHQELG